MNTTTKGRTRLAYSEKLKDPRWQRKRLEILQRDDFTCSRCTDNESTLHVHHKNYIKGRNPWDYEDDNFETLCEVCHEISHLPKTDLENLLIVLIWLAHREMKVPKENRINLRDEIYKQLKADNQ